MKEATGKWVNIQSSPGGSSFKVSIGIQRGYNVENTNEWATKATIEAQQGFKFLGYDGHVTVTGESAYTTTSGYTSTFQETVTTEKYFDFPAGVVWQWQFEITDVCGSTTAMNEDFAVTEGLYAPPCCLPGYAMDIKNSSGACHPARDGKVYNLCNSTGGTGAAADAPLANFTFFKKSTAAEVVV
mmetsp:Transcript_23163/g.66811  ORF Transcript_23163/g.66811 Transcript_23163/m.66811 type:complete len:185 (+) Transcript_23163:382-936(+)